MSEPVSRKQRWALPESTPVINEARQRRRAFLNAMEITTQSVHSEHEREARDDDITSYLTSDNKGA
jgi:hypothetical protein